MNLLTKDVVEKIVLEVLVDLSKRNGTSKEIASQSINIVNDEVDSAILSGVILTKIRPTIFSEEEENTKVTLSQMLQSGYDFLYEIDNETPLGLDSKLMDSLKYKDIHALIANTKLNFAIYQFVNAFHQYERIEKKYPELMKCM